MEISLQSRGLSIEEFLAVDIDCVEVLNLNKNDFGRSLAQTAPKLGHHVHPVATGSNTLTPNQNGAARAAAAAASLRAGAPLSWVHHPGLSTVRELSLSNCGLRTIAGIGILGKTLTKLRLGHNALVELPAEIAQLRALRSLSIPFNHLSRLPPEIASLRQLEALSLMANRLTVLPPELGRCTALKELYLRGNQLASLPKQLRSLQRLEALDLSENAFVEVPSVIVAFQRLTSLNVDGNSLMAVSKFRRWLFTGVPVLQMQIFKTMYWDRRHHALMRLASQGFHISVCTCVAAGRRAAILGLAPRLPLEIWEIVLGFLSGKAFVRVPPRAYRDPTGGVLWEIPD